MASYRYRAQIPAKILGASVNEGMADVVVFSKPIPGDLPIAQQAKKDGAKIIVDYCDDHFERFPIYKELADLADAVTCASKVMQERLRKVRGIDAEVIDDPYEFDVQKPHADGDKLLWFGSHTNIEEVVPYVKAGVPLSVVTGQNSVLSSYIPWSLENLEAALHKANVVLIPDGKETRSNNRAINAIAAGCFVVGGKQMSDMKKIIYSGPINHGLQFCRCFKNELNDMVDVAQAHVIRNHAPEVIAKQWEAVCASI